MTGDKRNPTFKLTQETSNLYTVLAGTCFNKFSLPDLIKIHDELSTLKITLDNAITRVDLQIDNAEVEDESA